MSLLSRMGTGNGLLVSLIIAFVAVESIVAASFLSLLQFKTSTAEVSHRQQSLLELERMVGTVAGRKRISAATSSRARSTTWLPIETP